MYGSRTGLGLASGIFTLNQTTVYANNLNSHETSNGTSEIDDAFLPGAAPPESVKLKVIHALSRLAEPHAMPEC